MDNRKNTILLTVIAVATLLVAVVGATFAYFTAQGGGSETAEVVVRTYKTATGSFATSNAALNVSASQDNFYQYGYSLQDTSTATAQFTGADGVNGDQYYCYTVSLDVTENEFLEEGLNSTHSGVLLFNASVTINTTAYSLDDNGSMSTASWVTESEGYVVSGTAGETTYFSGYDIMGLSTGDAYISIANATYNGNIYQISATANQTIDHAWNFSLTFVNKVENQNELTGTYGLRFSSQIKFTNVECSS